ncbi:VOC family protein [uncultured Roseovarius sp.]|uniref:VOC family protein n=1 Tax=uncultured Roseovarius sp. TaxID=293344 RepID=UPI002611B204|nr:VOC family protein [uncultured Roseovarius sp.]
MPADMVTGAVVWHDLHTPDPDGARRFFSALFGWSYSVEHSTNLVWTGREADYALIVADGTAHGGIVETGPQNPARWLGFVSVDDVDRATDRAITSGGHIEKSPFDVPGVGRSSVLKDPEGGTICPFKASHAYAPATSVFASNLLHGENAANTKEFYKVVCHWQVATPSTKTQTGVLKFQTAQGALAALVLPRRITAIAEAGWVPLIASSDVEASIAKAMTLGARPVLPCTRVKNIGDVAAMLDPCGAAFGILCAL